MSTFYATITRGSLQKKEKLVDAGQDITGLLELAGGGDQDAQQEVFRRVEDELRKIAESFMRGERPDHSLSSTVLVDEVFMRLVVGGNSRWTNRAHFYRAAAKAMRNLLVDYARQRNRQRRGREHVRIELDLNQFAQDSQQIDLLALDEALRELERLDPRQAEVVELHHFGGHTLQKTADILGVSLSTVKTDWASAKAWLHKQLAGNGDDS